MNERSADKAEKVDLFVLLPRRSEGARQSRVAGKAAISDGLINPHDGLPDDAAGADIEMSHLAVAHGALGQTDIGAAG